MSDTLLQETAFTAYRCCVCGYRVQVNDSEIGISSICKQCAGLPAYPGYVPIPWSEWIGELGGKEVKVVIRNQVGPWRP